MADPFTQALTSVLPAGVIAGALLAYPLSRLLLRFYHRSVARSMASESGAANEPSAAWVAATPPGVALKVVDAGGKRPPDVQAEVAYLFKAPWRGAAVYAAAGAVFAVVMTAAGLVATHDPAIPIAKLLLLFWTLFWPAVLTVNLVAGMRRSRWTTVCAYFGAFFVLVVVAVERNPSMRWHELPFYWLLTNGPPTLLLTAYLAKRIRAVGPMVLAFMILALTGSQVLVMVAIARNELLEVIANRAFAAGLSAGQFIWSMKLAGLFAFAAVGWFLLKWIGRCYERKRLSDQTLTIDALWLLFGIVHSIFLAFEGWGWFFTGLVAFAAFKAGTVIGFSLLRNVPRPKPRTLLLLRVFTLGTRSERLFDLLRTHWLRLGNITMIAGPDLITTTVEPHEFLDFLRGQLSRQFVKDRADLARRISDMDTKIDPDGRFRINELFCRANTWQITMRELAGCSDAVLMDLRSFSSVNRGCLFELGELLNSVDLARVVFVIDASTDRRFLESSLSGLWNVVSTDSPNRKHQTPAARLLDLDARLTEAAMRHLLSGLYTPIPTPDLVTPLIPTETTPHDHRFQGRPSLVASR